MIEASAPGPNRKWWRWVAAGSVLVASAALTVGVASAASTAGLQFTKVQYNSPGTDNRTNASLNGEWFQLINKATTTVSLTGWTVKDVANHTYKLTGTLAAGKTLTVHTGKGTLNKPSGHRYWGSKAYIWNNTGDTATLRTGQGTVVHKCTWGSTGSVKTCTAKPSPATTTKPPVQPTTPRPTTPPAPTPTTFAPTPGGEDTPPPAIG